MNTKILFKYQGNIFLGSAYFNDRIWINDPWGNECNVQDLEKIWIIENDDVRRISQDDLYDLLYPCYDQNDRKVHVGDYIAKIQDNYQNFLDKLVVYQVTSIQTTTVGVKVVHDSHCPTLSIMRDNIASSWAVIPLRNKIR